MSDIVDQIREAALMGAAAVQSGAKAGRFQAYQRASALVAKLAHDYRDAGLGFEPIRDVAERLLDLAEENR